MADTHSVLRAWFDAHATGDLDAARALLAPDATMRMPEREVRGFDEFMAWYEARRRSHAGFEYEVIDILGGEDHAAAVIRLRDTTAEWRQVAVYEIAEGRITGMTAYEDRREP